MAKSLFEELGGKYDGKKYEKTRGALGLTALPLK